ncbi:MAG: TonB family protein, partial [Polyangiaceae bacterium]
MSTSPLWAQSPSEEEAASPSDGDVPAPTDKNATLPAKTSDAPGKGVGKAAAAGVSFPKPLNYVAPVYPEQARREGVEAVVLLKLDISARGEVIRAEVYRSGGQAFDEAAKIASTKLRFSPARKADGTPFAARIVYRYKFEMKEVEIVKPKATWGRLEGRVEIAQLEVPLAGAEVVIKKPDGKSVARRSDGQGRFDASEL